MLFFMRLCVPYSELPEEWLFPEVSLLTERLLHQQYHMKAPCSVLPNEIHIYQENMRCTRKMKLKILALE